MNKPEIKWSVWDKSSEVRWEWLGQPIVINFAQTPQSVIPLPRHEVVAICANEEEFGAENLFIYTYDGTKKLTIAAPELGTKVSFGAIYEKGTGPEIEAQVGFFAEGKWVEKAGSLDLEYGILSNLHPIR